MPLSEATVTLDSGPGCVRQARTWAADSLRRLGRADLVEAAELGTSELVGNALLHARGPIRLQLRGTREHPRIEVRDGSPQLPPPVPRMLTDEEQLTTVGRGLALVAMAATAWGAEAERSGKVVWFEPAATIAERPTHEGHIAEAPATATGGAELVDGLPVALQQMPVDAYVAFTIQHQELRRELRLLSLAHGDTYPIATSISRVFRMFEDQIRRTAGGDALEEALEDGHTGLLDLQLVVPPELPHTASRMVDMLELADSFCRSERLLTLATSPEQRAFRRWYLGEFVRQGDGEAPTPWSHSLVEGRPA